MANSHQNGEPRTDGACQAAGNVALSPSWRRKLCFRAIAVAGVLLIAWGIPEVIVRLINPTLQTYRAIAFDNDSNSLKLFMKDSGLHWKLRPEVSTEFHHVPVRTNRLGFRGSDPAAGSRVVLCLGDSTPFGFGVAEGEAFPAQLEGRLNAAAKAGEHWTVINAGVPGYTSFQLRLLAEELIPRWKPSVVVVCVGNNEAWPADRSDRQLDADRGLSARLVELLSGSRFLVWAAETIRPDKPQPFVAPNLRTAVPRVSREEFVDNLRAIAQLARAANARLVLLGPPVNLFWQPLRTDQLPGFEKWKPICSSIRTAWNGGERQKALTMAQAALAANPDSPIALWINGVVVTDSGDAERGRELLEASIEHNPFPENCKRSYRDALAQLAREERAGYFDINDLFRRQSPGAAQQTLYMDWCHPQPQGHRLIAEALYEVIAGDKR